MSLDDGQIEFALDLFEALGPLEKRRMFGGMCLYFKGTVFALMRSDGTLFLKGAGAFRDRVATEGWEQWSHTRASGVISLMPYWRLPDSALDDPDEACDLARAALACL